MSFFRSIFIDPVRVAPYAKHYPVVFGLFGAILFLVAGRLFQRWSTGNASVLDLFFMVFFSFLEFDWS